LYSVSFNAHCGWAVGPQGTAIHTSDYGETWELVDLGTRENLNAVYMHDDLMAFIVGDNGLILKVQGNEDSFEVTQQTGNTTVDLNSVTSHTNGCQWISGDEGTVLRSDDMGITWEKQNAIYNNDLNSMHNIECTEAWAVGPDGFMMNTSDWGIVWNLIPTPTDKYLFSVHVGTMENIRVCGQQGLIMHTEDKGLTWDIEHEENGYNLLDVVNVGLNTAYAVGWDGKILETIDYGETWAEPGTDIDLLNTTLYDVEHQWGQDEWAVGYYGVILKNSGIETEFEIQNEGTLLSLFSVEFIDENTGWAAGGKFAHGIGNWEGIILHTTDGGQNWEVQLNSDRQFHDMDFINGNEGWVVGREGKIRHTVNGGTSWSTQDCPIDDPLTSVCFVDENYGWAVSMNNWGEIIHTSNGGTTWTQQTNPTINDLHDVFFIDQNKGWAVGLDSTILRTIDGGLNWERGLTNGANNYMFNSVYFIDDMHGWVVGIYNSIFLTSDGGKNWQQIESGISGSWNDVYFIDQNNGWVVGAGGIVIRTVDGGHSLFRQHTCVSTNSLYSVFFSDTLNGWCMGEAGTIINTSNGGFSYEPGTFRKNGVTLPINDYEVTESTIEVDVSGVIREGYILTGLEVYIDTILHSSVSDLEISLTHNDITETLVYHVTDDGENFLWTTFKDDAEIMITDGTAPFSGDHKPYQSLSVFNGTGPNGDWTLSIYDSENGHTGTLHAWGLKPLFEKTISIRESAVAHNNPVQLNQNIPNPFDRTTQISWKSDVSGHVVLKVYNLNGQEIKTLVNKHMPSGEYSVEFDGSSLRTGVYYCQLTIGKYSQTKKMVLMK